MISTERFCELIRVAASIGRASDEAVGELAAITEDYLYIKILARVAAKHMETLRGEYNFTKRKINQGD